MTMREGLLAIGLLAGTAFATSAEAATLTTPLVGENSENGIMFDIQSGANALTLQSLGVNVKSVGTFTFEIYKAVGGIAGKTNNAAAFTLVGSFTNVVAQPQGTLTLLDFTDFGLAANSVLGLYVTIADSDQTDPPAGSRIAYSNGTAVGNVVASDSDLSIKTGVGKQYPFGTEYNARNFNGSITYAVGTTSAVPEPASWAMLIVGFGATGMAMRRHGKASPRVRFA